MATEQFKDTSKTTLVAQIVIMPLMLLGLGAYFNERIKDSEQRSAAQLKQMELQHDNDRLRQELSIAREGNALQAQMKNLELAGQANLKEVDVRSSREQIQAGLAEKRAMLLDAQNGRQSAEASERLRLAIQVLGSETKPGTELARQWALDVLNGRGYAPLSTNASKQLHEVSKQIWESGTFDLPRRVNIGLGYKMGSNTKLVLGYDGVFWDVKPAYKWAGPSPVSLSLAGLAYEPESINFDLLHGVDVLFPKVTLEKRSIAPAARKSVPPLRNSLLTFRYKPEIQSLLEPAMKSKQAELDQVVSSWPTGWWNLGWGFDIKSGGSMWKISR